MRSACVNDSEASPVFCNLAVGCVAYHSLTILELYTPKRREDNSTSIARKKQAIA